MSRYCVIGSGISGATIANLLSKKNSVDLFDKAKGPGGRSSFKRIEKAKGFDHGTQYISPKSLAFKRFVNTLIKKKFISSLQHAGDMGIELCKAELAIKLNIKYTQDKDLKI